MRLLKRNQGSPCFEKSHQYLLTAWTKKSRLSLVLKAIVAVSSITMSAILAGYFASATIFTLCSLLLYLSLVYPFLLSPLAKIPNAHWTSPFVPWWILWKRYRRQELLAANGAHQRLGPIVRLGPKDLSVSCYEDGIRKIYGGGFDKPNYYDFFNYYGFACHQ